MMYNIFGSADSLDYDVMFRVPAIPVDKQESKALITDLESFFPKTDKKVNANICTLEDGQIKAVYKGTADECNNSLFYTYNNHVQDYKCMTSTLVMRDIALKVDRSLRILLSFLSRTEYRQIVKTALLSPTTSKRENCINCLMAIDFNSLKSFGTKNGEPLDIIKQIAFQIAQVVGLLERRIEIYTKAFAVETFPALYPYLMRESSNLENLQRYKSIYLYEISMWRQFKSTDSNGWRDNV